MFLNEMFMNAYPTICFEGHVFVVCVSLCYVSRTNVSRRISSNVFWETCLWDPMVVYVMLLEQMLLE
jgi:hypothetical protein